MLKHLDKLLFEETEETPAQIRQQLESEGIDVQGMVTRLKVAVGEAYRQRLLKQENPS